MKQVVLNKFTDIIEAEKCTDENKYYGVLVNMPPYPIRKGFIKRDAYGQGNFRVYCIYRLTKNNTFGWYGKTIAELCESILCNSNSHKIYVFDTCTDLLKWLIKD